jgi:hypothetical protein
MARMNRRLSLLIALAVGVLLAWLVVAAAGVLAAIPVPGLLTLLNARAHPALAVFVSMTLTVHAPVALLALAVGWLLLRALRQSSPGLVWVCAVPWLTLMVAELLDYFLTAQLPATTKLEALFAWYNWPGYLAVPFGLWLASRMPGTRPLPA